MLRPEPYYSEVATSRWASVSSQQDTSTRQTRRKQQNLDQAAEVDALVAALVPTDVSANKRAIVRHLIKGWVEEQSRLA
jgi:hypothetical protein